jgi:MSHA biogenesis protein MshK
MLTNKFSGFFQTAKQFVPSCIVLFSVFFSMSGATLANTLTDPTRPPGQSRDASVTNELNNNAAVTITAVLKKNQVSYAVINGSWLKKGEKIGVWRVTDITNAGVFLKNENEPEGIPLRFLVNEKSDFKKQTNNE